MTEQQKAAIQEAVKNAINEIDLVRVKLADLETQYDLKVMEIDALKAENQRYKEVLEKFANMKQEDVSGEYVVGNDKYPVEEAARVLKNYIQLINHLAQQALKGEKGGR